MPEFKVAFLCVKERYDGLNLSIKILKHRVATLKTELKSAE